MQSRKRSRGCKGQYDAFQIFDQGRIGQITVSDLREGLNAIGVYPTLEEVELFMTRYDRTKDRRLSFTEFAEAFLPADPFVSKVLNRRPRNISKNTMYRRDDCFLSDT
jgi:EF-hand domain pair